MSIISQLASSLNRRDEVPNQELARHIANSNDAVAVKELVDNLANKNKSIQSDCIKTLDELAYLKPAMVAPYVNTLIALLDSKNNRLQWGAMTALNAITDNCSAEIYHALSKIIAVADAGTIITNDHCINILVKLAAVEAYADDALSLLMERLLKSPPNQLPMYAENILPAINIGYKPTFIKVLTSRLGDIEKDTKRVRVEKVLKTVRKSN